LRRSRTCHLSHDRDVHGAAALRCRAQLGQDQGLELRFCLRQLLGFCLQRLVGHGPLLKIALRQRLNAGAFFCACRTPMPRTRCATPHPRERGAGTCSQQTQNLGGARRGAASRRLGIGIKPSRWACFLAALRARRMASAFSRVLRSDGFSYALRRFISRKTPSRCSFFLRALRA